MISQATALCHLSNIANVPGIFLLRYAKTWAEAFEKIPNLYSARPPVEDFFAWRDLRVMDEIHWYGWFIDYWMEGGLLRDIFTHKITTNYHWNLLMMPTVYSKSEVAYDLIIGNQTVSPQFDPNCVKKVSTFRFRSIVPGRF